METTGDPRLPNKLQVDLWAFTDHMPVRAISLVCADVRVWPEASGRCPAAIRPESGVKTCQDTSTAAFDPFGHARSAD